MKTRFSKLIPILLSLTLFLNVGEVEGKSTIWSSGNIGTPLGAYWSNVLAFGPAYGPYAGYAQGLKNFTVSVSHEASVYKNGTLIDDGVSIAVGDIISFSAPLTPTDINWFGTGYSEDSPYGHWIADAAAPSTWVADLITIMNGSFYIYVPFSVNPPTITHTHTGSTAGLDCNGDGVADSDPVGPSCVVKSGGTILTQVNYSDTYGKFYYTYKSGTIQYYTKKPMIDMTPYVIVPDIWTGESVKFCADYGPITAPERCAPNPPPYSLPIPAQTITFSLTAVSNNNPPTPPTITGVSSANLGTTNTFTFNGTDPDGDNIYYRIDWNNDGTVDGLSPTSGFVSSGSNSTSNYTLPSTGTTFTFKARTADSKGGVSAWTTKTVTLLQAINGECGQANGEILSSAPSGAALCFTPGVASSITTNPTTWTWTCSGTNGGNPSPTCTTTKQGPMVNVYFSLLDRLKLFTSSLLSSSALIDRVLAEGK